MSEAFWKKAIANAVRRGTQCEVEDLDRIQSVWGGNGEVLRAQLSGGVVESAVIKKVVLPRAKKKRGDKSTERTVASYDNELLFYQRWAPTLPDSVRTPQLYAGQKLSEGWLFVLEDLQQSGLRSSPPSLTEEQVRAALRWLAGFHAHFLGDSGDGLWKAGSYWNVAARGEELSKMKDLRLKSFAEPLDRALNNSTYKTIVHGDAKTDNFCFSETEAVGLDFQHTGLGCGMKDVMCLFDSCLSPLEAAARAPDLLEHYFARLRTCLSKTAHRGELEAIETEWRRLYPLAWADYYRFLDGWAPGRYPPEGYASERVEQALSSLAR